MTRRRSAGVLLFALLAVGCARQEAGPAAQADPSPSSARVAPLATAAEGADFGPDARLLYRVVACAGEDTLPPSLDAAVIDDYCRWLRSRMSAYQENYLARALPFLAALRPAGLPTTVVYPFGGGDLLSALNTFPDGLEFTTLSLEHSGDPTRIGGLEPARLERSLSELRRRLTGFLAHAQSTSENLMQLEKSDIPGQLAFFLVALAVRGYEPVSLRYFSVEPDGSLHYLSREEIAAEGGTRAQHLNQFWTSPEFSVAFSNSELVFRPRGKPGPVRVHRHLAVNLSNDHLKLDPSPLRHLEAKGPVVALTKAASYLLWAEGFNLIRRYLLEHVTFMISDSTGIPPDDARRAGFVLETYGRFDGPYLAARKSVAEAFRRLWAEQPYRELPFRYGYPDAKGQSHLLIMRRPAGSAASGGS